MKWTRRLTGFDCASLLLSSVSAWAGPKIVSGPGANAGCFKPWSDKTKFFQWDKKPGPYKIALVNGFVGNTWRIQMVKTAKAFAEQAGIKENIKEFKVVSTGTDVAAQLGAMEDFINQGFDAIITIAVVPADALAVHGHFDGVFTQGGSDGTVQAMVAAKHAFVPMSGEGENEFRKQIADHAKDGLKGMSYGQSPALVAIATKAAISALQGNVMPQLISLPTPAPTYKHLKPRPHYCPPPT